MSKPKHLKNSGHLTQYIYQNSKDKSSIYTRVSHAVSFIDVAIRITVSYYVHGYVANDGNMVARGRREEKGEKQRWQEEHRRRREEVQGRSAEEQRFLHLFAILTTSPTPKQAEGLQSAVAMNLPASVPSSGTLALKASAQPPPPLAQKIALRSCEEWRQLWDNYAVMIDLHGVHQHKQLIQVCLYLSADTRWTIRTVLACLTSDLLLEEVLQQIRDFVRDQRNEALGHLAFNQCRQAHAEKFVNFYVRLKQITDYMDLCKGPKNACIETQIKHII